MNATAMTPNAGLPEPDGGYRAEWFEFDNATGAVRDGLEASSEVQERITIGVVAGTRKGGLAHRSASRLVGRR